MSDIALNAYAVGRTKRPELETGGHICLAGLAVTNDWSLIEPLKRSHQVTVVERPRMLHANSILATAQVLVLDCGEDPALGIGAVRGLRYVYPEVDIVLVNGEWSPAQIAQAFREGVRDYFARQASAELVVERVQNLCRRARRSGGRH